MLHEMSRRLVIAIALCGCHDADLDRVKQVRDEVCKCTTVQCGEDAMNRLPSHAGNPSHRAQVLASEMLTCMAKLYAQQRPSLDPDRPVDPGSDVP